MRKVTVKPGTDTTSLARFFPICGLPRKPGTTPPPVVVVKDWFSDIAPDDRRLLRLANIYLERDCIKAVGRSGLILESISASAQDPVSDVAMTWEQHPRQHPDTVERGVTEQPVRHHRLHHDMRAAPPARQEGGASQHPAAADWIAVPKRVHQRAGPHPAFIVEGGTTDEHAALRREYTRPCPPPSMAAFASTAAAEPASSSPAATISLARQAAQNSFGCRSPSGALRTA